MDPMNRRKLLKNTGIGALALAAAPALGHQLARPAAASGQTNFHFLAVNFADVVDDVVHAIGMTGDGAITPANVVGGGSFFHFDNDPAKPVPKPLLETGTWKARRLISFNMIGTYGVAAAGVLDMEVDLLPVSGPRVPARLEVSCNIGPAGLMTGNPEGYVLSIPGAPFGDFVPVVPPLGLTLFTIANERRRS